MFKKALSLIIAIVMLASVAVVGASAAEADLADTAAETEVRDTADAGKIYFQVPDDWNNYKSIFCHLWAIDGTGTWPAWQAKAEKCKLVEGEEKLYYYDLSKLTETLDPAKGVAYAVIFSANTGIQTYNALMSADCIGDTLYCTGKLLENPEDSEKTAIEAAWKNHSDAKYGPEKKITSSGSVVGTALPEGSTDATLVATYIVAYLGDTTKTDAVPGLISQLGTTPEAVYAECVVRLTENGDEEAAAKQKQIYELLGITEEEAKKEEQNAANKLEEKNPGSSNSVVSSDGSKVEANNSSNGSSAGSNGGSSAGSSSTGSSSPAKLNPNFIKPPRI